MKGTTAKSPTSSAFTIIEMVVLLAIIGLLATTAIRVFSGVPKSTDRQKLKSDMIVLNSALQIYLASGGKVENSDTADDVIRKLVSVTNSKYAHLVPGLSGSFVDRRIKPVYLEKEEQADGISRVVWSNAKCCFELLEGGPAGIKKFILDDSMAYVSEEEERNFVFLYSENENWIWEYNSEDEHIVYNGPSQVATTPVNGDSAPLIPNLDEADPVEPAEAVLPPVFSMPGGSYDCSDFDIVLDLRDPNEGINSAIYYRRDYGSWVAYEESLTITPNTVIEAQVVANHMGYSSSGILKEHFTLNSVTLAKPAIEVSVKVEDTVYVSLEITGPTGLPGVQTEYRIDGGEWIVYEAPFNVGVKSLLTTFGIEARVVVTDNKCFENSEPFSLAVDVAAEISLTDLPVIDLPIGIPGVLDVGLGL